MTDTATTEPDVADNLPVRAEHQGSYLPAPAEWRTITQMADTLARSQLVPASYRGRPENVILATLAGRPFGWDPTMSMRSFHIIEGVPSLKPEILLALVRQAGHSVTGEATPTGATVTGTRKDTGDTMTATFTMADARSAELAGKKNWRNYPADMCWARALSAVCRRLFSDVVLGVGYTPEEVGADDGYIEATHTADPDRDRADELKDRARALPDPAKAAFSGWFFDEGMTYRSAPHLAAIQAKLNELETGEIVDAEVIAQEVAPDLDELPPPAAVIDVKVPPGPVADDLEQMTAAQQKKLFALLKDAKITGDRRHAWAGSQLGRDVESFNDLTRVEASKLIDTLSTQALLADGGDAA